MKLQSKLANGVISLVTAGGLLLSTPSYAEISSFSGWAQVVGGGIGVVLGTITINAAKAVVMLAINLDPAQLALEYLVYDAMQDVTDHWEPEPQDNYKKAAQDNDDGSRCGCGSVTSEGAQKFEIQVLKDVGLESIGFVKTEEFLSGRADLINYLTLMTLDGATVKLDTSKIPMNELREIHTRQTASYQWLSSAGVARSELGLKTVTQAMADAENAGGAKGVSSEVEDKENDVEMAADAGYVSSQSLSSLPGSVSSTAGAMTVQTLMNLELAQRMNLTNMLQGNVLAVEAARALRNAK